MRKEEQIRTLAEQNPKIPKTNIASIVDQFFTVISEAWKRGVEV